MWIFKIYALTNFFAFIVGIFKYRFLTKELKTVFYFVALGVLTESYMKIHKLFIMKNTSVIGHFYFPIAFLIVGLFFVQVLKDFIKPKYILSIIIAFLVYCLVNSLFIQSILEYASLESAIGSITVFLFSVAYFSKVMIESKIQKLSREPLIWINTAFLIYYAGNFFFYISYNVRLNAPREILVYVAKVFYWLNFLFYLIIACGFLIVKKDYKPLKR